MIFPKLSAISVGGLFKHDGLLIKGKPYPQLAVGSGGATCADYRKRNIIGWSSMAVFECTSPTAGNLGEVLPVGERATR